MESAGFKTEFGPGVLNELNGLGALPVDGTLKDMTTFHWSSIDNQESRDLDQLEYVEKRPSGEIRLLLAVADVARYVTRDGAIDAHAGHNTTSVYTGVSTFHMLPEQLSTNRTSLLEDQPRAALVIELLLQADGSFTKPMVFRALVRNRARLNYEEAGNYFSTGAPSDKIRSLSWLPRQLEIQAEAASRLSALRKKAGALTFSSFEARPVTRGGVLVDLKMATRNSARDLIESFMIAANIGTAAFLKSHGWPIVERVVTAPRRWDRLVQIAEDYGHSLPGQPDQKALSGFLAVERAKGEAHFQTLSFSVVKLLGPGEYIVEYPDGPQRSHFGLAVDDYSHSTAPNRRFADLVLQRLLHALLGNEGVPYDKLALERIAQRCTEREDAARKVERLMRKVCAASLLRNQIGETFRGVVTGASFKGTYARLFDFPAEGRVVRGERGLDVGNTVKLKLIDLDIENGFIDFARV